HLFATAGISLTSSSSANGIEAKHMLIESRLNYARRLKDRFLSGVARFLLQDQDPAGIAKLEHSLTEHIDDALRFSCQLWARPGPIRFHGFAAVGGQAYKGGGRLVELCRAQQQGPKETTAGQEQGQGQGQMVSHMQTSGPPRPGHYDGRPVVMVIQPAIEGFEIGSGGEHGDTTKPSKTSKVWLKARVLNSASVTTSVVQTNPSVRGPVPKPGPGVPAKPGCSPVVQTAPAAFRVDRSVLEQNVLSFVPQL
ncbi:hypothetical protein N0V85_006453, partial [Neurospora sp. IMI 360204]